MVQERVDAFKNFLQEHYEDRIDNLKNVSQGAFIEIDYSKVKQFNGILADDLQDKPTESIKDLETALKQLTDLPQVQVIIEQYNEVDTQISELRDNHLDKLVRINGIVSQQTSVVPLADKATFRCGNGHISKVKQRMNTELEYPMECQDDECSLKRNRDFRLLPHQSTKINFQRLEIQEPHEEVTGGETPESISVHVRGALAGQVTAGDKVTITGTYKAISQSGTSVLKTYVNGVNITAEQKEFEQVEITDEDAEQIKQLASDEEIYDRIIDSIAPTIKGLESEKEAVAYQLFRGVRKSEMSTDIRGDIHILLVGDPSVGKSQLLRYVSEIAPRGVMTSGKGASEAGLTVATVRSSDMGDEEEWQLKAGAMVLADEGVACIDEMDKMDSSDRTAMFEGLEQQTISVAKAGITATLKSRCALLGAANPKEGRWNKYDPITAQIDLEPPLVSRFDLIFAPKDERDEEQDKQLAEHILETNKYGQQLEAGLEIDGSSNDIEPDIPPELLKKYVAYARSNCNPVMTDEAQATLQKFFVSIRNEDSDDESVPITARKIEGLVRISEACARIQLSDTVEKHHAERAVRIVKESLKDVGYDEEAGRFDIDKIEAGETVTQKERKNALLEVVSELADDGERGAPINSVISTMEERGFNPDKISEVIDKQKTNGELYEPITGEVLEL